MTCLKISSGFPPDGDDGNDETHRAIFKEVKVVKLVNELKQLKRRTMGIHGIVSASKGTDTFSKLFSGIPHLPRLFFHFMFQVAGSQVARWQVGRWHLTCKKR